MITFNQKGKFKKLDNFFQKALDVVNLSDLDKYGKKGVEALKASTPKDTGKTAESWGYEIERNNGRATIKWYNTNIQDGCNIAVILQYGHVSRNGSWVEGTDYINPAIKPIFNEIAEEAWKEVKKL